MHRHAVAEAECPRNLGGRCAACDRAAAAAACAAEDQDVGVDPFERDSLARDPEAVAEFCTVVLDSSLSPGG